MKINFKVNGEKVTVEATPEMRLLDILHDTLGFIEVKEGCGKGECGACTVMFNGRKVNSCLVPALQLEGSNVVTVTGLQKLSTYKNVERMYVEYGAVQCGFCMGGFLMSTVEFMLHTKPPYDRQQVVTALAGNICRCTGYTKIVEAVENIVNDEDTVKGINEEWEKKYGK